MVERGKVVDLIAKVLSGHDAIHTEQFASELRDISCYSVAVCSGSVKLLSNAIDAAIEKFKKLVLCNIYKLPRSSRSFYGAPVLIKLYTTFTRNSLMERMSEVDVGGYKLVHKIRRR